MIEQREVELLMLNLAQAGGIVVSKKDIIAQLWNQSMYDYDHTSANLERFYDASRADLEQRLSEANKVIKMAKEDLLTFSRTGKSEWAYEAIAAIEAYEKGKK